MVNKVDLSTVVPAIPAFAGTGSGDPVSASVGDPARAHPHGPCLLGPRLRGDDRTEAAFRGPGGAQPRPRCRLTAGGVSAAALGAISRTTSADQRGRTAS